MTVIKIKRGSTVPTTSNLESYELGFVTSTDDLYINNNGTITRLGIKVLSGTDTPSAVTGADNDIYIKYSTSGNDTTIDTVYIKMSGSWIALPTGGASVLMGTTDPTAAIGEDGNLYIKYHTESNVPIVDGFYVKISGVWATVSSGGGGATYLELTQAQYDALSSAQKNNGTIYFITDAGWGNHTLSGTAVPSAASGENGDFYIRLTESGGVTSVSAMYVKITNTWLEVATGGGGSLPQSEGVGF